MSNVGRQLTPVIAAFCLVVFAGPVARAADGRIGPIEAIDRDYRDGHLTLDQRVLLYITAIKNPEGLPPAYQLFDPATRVTASRLATPAIKQILEVWDELEPGTQAAFQRAFVRPLATDTYISLSGFFKLHYNVTGPDQVPSADTDFSGIPDFVEKCAAYCDTSLQLQLSFSFLPPPGDGSLGGDTLYDVYFEDMGFYGYTVPEGAGPRLWDDYYSYLVLHHNFLGFPPNTDPEGNQYGAAKVTAAHEFHHAVQFGYDFWEATWIIELDATCWEDLTFDLTNDNYNYLATFFSQPEVSLHDNSSHAYSCFIWGLYLAQRFDTTLLRTMWEGARYDDIFSTVSDTLEQVYGWTQDAAFAEFVAWNYITGSRDDGLHHEEAAFYPEVAVGRTHALYPVDLQSSPKNLPGYGSCYIEFYPGGSVGTLRLTVNGSNNRQWAAYLIKSTANDVHVVEIIDLQPPGYLADVDVTEFESYYRVTLAMANVSEFSTGAQFYYSAEVVIPYAVSSAILTPDSAVYSGGERLFEYQVSNVSQFNDVFDVSFWDDRGWVVPDTIDKAIPPGGDSTFLVSVTAPVATPLGEMSQLFFAVRSWGDSMVVDTQSTMAMTVLQRGDADFSGELNVADLSYLVTYLFLNGPAPIPELLAGDFDCTNEVNVADLSAMVTYLFLMGTPPPCNPY